ncbi:hypothetical protein LTR56_016323 [Elasticomyces elasticus]|nr:hypothetical protein LTR56_016323 [Elasticomyces elasticus]KAK3657701.1 hypothetical protein LTR22_009253 [Elasticomyces elasticus]KAK4922506.1 hypothetical protein LTR49_010206 [Elasticomyces elasticus]KAK5760593.1 hypothetical protein LTS12_009302 [Elasticomyces elasticus]
MSNEYQDDELEEPQTLRGRIQRLNEDIAYLTSPASPHPFPDQDEKQFAITQGELERLKASNTESFIFPSEAEVKDWGKPNELLFSLPERPIDLTSSTGGQLASGYSVFRLPTPAQREPAVELDAINQCEAFALDNRGRLVARIALHAQIEAKFGPKKHYKSEFDNALNLCTQGLTAGELNFTEYADLHAYKRPELQARATGLAVRAVLHPPCDHSALTFAEAGELAAARASNTQADDDTMPGAVPTPYYQPDGRNPFYSDWDPSHKDLPELSFTQSADRAELDLSKTGDIPLYNLIHSRFTNWSPPPGQGPALT